MTYFHITLYRSMTVDIKTSLKETGVNDKVEALHSDEITSSTYTNKVSNFLKFIKDIFRRAVR